MIIVWHFLPLSISSDAWLFIIWLCEVIWRRFWRFSVNWTQRNFIVALKCQSSTCPQDIFCRFVSARFCCCKNKTQFGRHFTALAFNPQHSHGNLQTLEVLETNLLVLTTGKLKPFWWKLKVKMNNLSSSTQNKKWHCWTFTPERFYGKMMIKITFVSHVQSPIVTSKRCWMRIWWETFGSDVWNDFIRVQVSADFSSLIGFQNRILILDKTHKRSLNSSSIVRSS